MKKYNLVDLQLHEEEITKGATAYYLSAVCKYEDESGVYEMTIPKIRLPLHDPIIKQEYSNRYYGDRITVNIGFGDMDVIHDKKGNPFYVKCVKEKIHDMTLDEIEKKLGFKVRVVSEKEA